jgi:ActR/RegA family two-component response regulator
MKILVIDDDIPTVTQLKTFMESLGHECFVAHSAHKGIDENKHLQPQLVLVEIELGAKADLDLLAGLVRDNPRASIVILASQATVHRAVEAMKHGASDYLQKPYLDAPVDMEKLKKMLAAHVVHETN